MAEPQHPAGADRWSETDRLMVGAGFDLTNAQARSLLAALDAAEAERDRLRDAVLDIDAHAAPIGSDEDGFVAGGYVVSVGAIHRALGVVGHAAAECTACERGTAHDCNAPYELFRSEVERRHLVDALRELVEAASPFLGNETACKGCQFEPEEPNNG